MELPQLPRLRLHKKQRRLPPSNSASFTQNPPGKTPKMSFQNLQLNKQLSLAQQRETEKLLHTMNFIDSVPEIAAGSQPQWPTSIQGRPIKAIAIVWPTVSGKNVCR